MWLFLLTAYICDGAPQAPGGFFGEAITADVEELTKEAIDLFFVEEKITGSECSHAELLEILEVRTQIVAGQNFELKLKLETKEGSDCSKTVEKICEKIVVFRPLSNDCFGGGCLELIRRDEIICETLPPPPISGGFGSEEITNEVKNLARQAAEDLALSVDYITGGCYYAKFVEVSEVETQYVSGKNFKLKLKIETKEGPGCSDKVEKICENFIVYRPFPRPGCVGDCLELIRQEEINCETLAPQPTPPGGFAKFENVCNGIPQDVVILASRAANEFLHLENKISGECTQSELVEVLDAESQIVSGTNYKLKLKIRTREGQGCFAEVEKICENIILNLPIPCFGGDCLGLIRNEEISCK